MKNYTVSFITLEGRNTDRNTERGWVGEDGGINRYGQRNKED